MIDWKYIQDIEIHGLDPKDYPDFADATVLRAWNRIEDRECTEEELDYINTNYGAEINEHIHMEVL